MKANRLHLPWTPRDLAVMRKAAIAGKTAAAAARTLRRSRGAVAYKAMVEGVRFCGAMQPRGTQRKANRTKARNARAAARRVA